MEKLVSDTSFADAFLFIPFMLNIACKTVKVGKRK